MYCNNCGKHNPEDSKFCKSCGTKIIKVPAENKTTNHAQAKTNSLEVENTNTVQSSEKVDVKLGGWVAVVGLGLIVGLLEQVFGLLDYLPMLSDTYDIPGFLTILQFEFLVGIIFVILNIYIFYLYLKRNSNFPKYYTTALIASCIYVVLDHLLFASLNAPTRELQRVLTDTLSENISEVTSTVVISVIWILYMKKSKRVKATFVKDK